MKFKITNDSTGNGSNALKVEVSYTKGGMSFYDYKEVKRGYYLHVQPEKHDGMWVSFVGFSGFKTLIEETKRLNSKKLQDFNSENFIREMVEKFHLKQWARNEGYDVVWGD